MCEDDSARSCGATVSVRACGTLPQVRFDEKPQQRHNNSGSAWTVKPFA